MMRLEGERIYSRHSTNSEWMTKNQRRSKEDKERVGLERVDMLS